MSTRWILTLVVVAALSACERPDFGPATRGTISERRFTQVFGDLIIARIETLPDTVAYRERRRQILENAGLTTSDIETFVEAHGRDSDRMAEVYRRVRARIDTLSMQRSRAAASDPLDPVLADTLAER